MKLLLETKIKKIAFLLFLFLALCLPAFSYAYEVVALKSADIKPYNEALEGFKSSCDCEVRELVLTEIRGDVLRKVLKTSPDAVLAIGIDAFAELKGIKDLPVIYTVIPRKPVDLEENISGVSMYISPEKYLDAMLEMFPGMRRIGIIYNQKSEGEFVNEAIQAAQSRGIDLILKKTHSAAEAPSLIDGMANKIDIFWMLPDMAVMNSETINYMLLFSFQNRVPVFTFSKKYIDLGAVAGLNIVPFDLGAQAGEIARKLLYGKDAEAPIRVDARRIVPMINEKVARKMGIKVKSWINNGGEVVNK